MTATTPRQYHAVIPTIGKSPYLLRLLERLLADDACVFIDLPDNGTEPRYPDVHALSRLLAESTDVHPEIVFAVESGRIMLRRTSGTIYRSWNEAMDAARYTPLAVLNDDIVLGSESIHEALRWLDPVSPIVGLNYRRRVAEGTERREARSVNGTFRLGGMGGFAFVVLPNYCARVDPRFTWWYGDDDLVYRTVHDLKRAVLVAEGAPVDHPEPSISGNQMDWLDDAISADVELFRQLWPDAA